MSDSVEPILELRGIQKFFDGRQVLKDINLVVAPGETVVILGPSGCGKSTLLRTIIGEETPDSGHVYLWGEDACCASPARLDRLRQRFGILFQSGALYSSMTVGENVALPLREHTDLDDDIIRMVIKMKLELVGLRDFENLMPNQISGGMRKRVGLARAIARDPEILFYDEPTSGLDPIATSVIDQLIIDLGAKLGVTSIVVTHDMKSALHIGDRIAMLYGGEFIAVGRPDVFRIASTWLRRFQWGPLEFQDKNIFAFNLEQVDSVILEEGSHRVRIQQDLGSKMWRVVEPVVMDADLRKTLYTVNALSDLRALRVSEGSEPGAAGLDQPRSRFIVELIDGSSVMLEVGHAFQADHRTESVFAWADGRLPIYELNAEAYTRLRQAFLKN